MNNRRLLIAAVFHFVHPVGKDSKKQHKRKSEKNELDLLCRQKYYITSTTPWYNPISITVVLSGVIVWRQNAL